MPGKPLSPIPEPIGAGDLTQAKVFTGPRGALMQDPIGTCASSTERKGGERSCSAPGGRWSASPSGNPFWGGGYDPRQEASYKGTVEGLTACAFPKRPRRHGHRWTIS